MARRQYRERRQKRALMSEMNVVPYIDVMLVLLVIFMITAPLLTTGVEVNLPKASAKPVDPAKQADPLILSISGLGQWFLNIGEQTDEALEKNTVQTLVTEALRETPGRSVLVAADKDIDYGTVMEAMVTLQSAGADQIQLMSDQPQSLSTESQ